MKHQYNKKIVYKIAGLFFALLPATYLHGQDSPQSQVKTYNSYKAPLIEDNSFLIEEAFNQEAGVVQFISTAYFTKLNRKDMAYSLTHEIPLKGVKHQISYTLTYFMLSSQQPGLHGLGDLLVNYRYELAGKNNWALITPRLSLILPTGDVNRGLGSGAWGGQVNMPVSKMISNKLVTHYNAGFTLLHQAKYISLEDNNLSPSTGHNLTYINAGASIIWMPTDKINLMLEYVSNFNDEFETAGQISRSHQMLINPGIRYAFDAGRSQIVPGISMPTSLHQGHREIGMFFYLSIEPNFNSNNK